MTIQTRFNIQIINEMNKRAKRANRNVKLMSAWVFVSYVVGNLLYSLFDSLVIILDAEKENNHPLTIVKTITVVFLFLAYSTEILIFVFFDKSFRKTFRCKFKRLHKIMKRLKIILE